MAIVASTLARIKSDPLAALGGKERVNKYFADAGHVWQDRKLGPATTLSLFILQVLHFNTAISHLRHLSGLMFCESSYCVARVRLPVVAVAGLIDTICSECRRCSEDAGLWFGRRVFLADATSASTPDEPVLQDLWPQPAAQKSGCGFPAIKLLGLVDLATGMIVHLTLMCLNVHEMSQLPAIHAVLRAGDVLLADRGFCSYWHVAMLLKSSVDAVFRMHQRQIVDFTPNRPHRAKKGRRAKRGVPTSQFIRRLGHEDQVVRWLRPPSKPAWMSQEQYARMPETIEVREVRYHIVARGRRTRGVTIVTTLLDPMRFPKREIARLYGLRWEIETNFRHLKTTMKMDRLKCRTPEGVIKELMIFVLVYNMVRMAMTAAAECQGVDANRVSFIDALRLLCSKVRRMGQDEVIELKVNRIRPGRYQPRVLKRRIKPYDLMNRPRREYAEPAMAERVID
jgi:hypothetical protein